MAIEDFALTRDVKDTLLLMKKNLLLVLSVVSSTVLSVFFLNIQESVTKAE